jgi:hypothetical protein
MPLDRPVCSIAWSIPVSTRDPTMLTHVIMGDITLKQGTTSALFEIFVPAPTLCEGILRHVLCGRQCEQEIK